jgi:hypothetical protein
MTTATKDTAMITATLSAAIQTENCPAVAFYLPSYEKECAAHLAVIDEPVPDPRDANASLPHRVVRVVDSAGNVRLGHNHLPLPVTALFAELRADRERGKWLCWKPYGSAY